MAAEGLLEAGVHPDSKGSPMRPRPRRAKRFWHRNHRDPLPTIAAPWTDEEMYASLMIGVGFGAVLLFWLTRLFDLLHV